MNIAALKNEIVARRHQLVVIDRAGRLTASCDSIMPLMQHAGQEVLSLFFMFQGLESAILQLQPGDPHIHLPMLAFPYEDKEYLLSIDLWAQAGVEGILWMMNQEDVPSERLRHIQQDRNEIHIGLEQMTEQEQTLREYTQQLEEAHKALQRFSYIVSHDLKAPLRTIGNLATWISEAFEAGDLNELPQFIRLMHSRVQRMEGLIDGIFRYHRAGYEGQSQEEINLRTLLFEIQETLINPNHCKIDLPIDLPILYSSRTALYQVFSNLLINACKHSTQADCLIEVRFADMGQHYKFGVIDNGPGIDPIHHERIFEIFQTLKSKDDDDTPGIGLSIVKRIVEDAGHKIWVESSLGNGAAFWFTWPKNEA